MSAALITATLVSVAALLASTVSGYLAATTEALVQHATLSIFATLLVLLAYSLTMFYLIGKGRAVREAVQAAGLSGTYVQEIARLRRPVFSHGTLAMLLTMTAAIVGGGTDTGVIPPLVHGFLGVGAAAANLVALRTVIRALRASALVVGEIDRRLAG